MTKKVRSNLPFKVNGKFKKLLTLSLYIKFFSFLFFISTHIGNCNFSLSKPLPVGPLTPLCAIITVSLSHEYKKNKIQVVKKIKFKLTEQFTLKKF